MGSNTIDKKEYYIYIHTNLINNKKYIGITSFEPEQRWKNGNGYKHNVHFNNAIQKYGWDNFRHEIVLKNETFDYACKVERCLIKHYKSNDPNFGYNLTSGGEKSSGVIMSDESKRKMSNAQKKRFSNPENHPRYGVVLSEKTKEKISNGHKGLKVSQDTRKKMSNGKTGTKNGRAKKPVYCPELNELFWGAKAVEEKYGFNRSDIAAVCKGKHKHCGKHPITNELLTWKYVDKSNIITYIVDILNHMIVKEENYNEYT